MACQRKKVGETYSNKNALILELDIGDREFVGERHEGQCI